MKLSLRRPFSLTTGRPVLQRKDSLMLPTDWNFYDDLNAGVSLDIIRRTIIAHEDIRTVIGEEPTDESEPISYIPTVNASGVVKRAA